MFSTLSIQLQKVALVILVMLLLVAPFSSRAQESVSPEVVTTSEPVPGVILANVNLTEATVVTQSADNLTISFNLGNGDPTPHFDIRYGAELLSIGADGSQALVDNLIAKEVLTLGANQTISKVFDYPIGAIASGTYSVWVTAQTAGGVMLGLGNAGTISISNPDTVEIMADSCIFTIAGEEGLPEYDLYQGVDVATSEEMILTCMVQNHGAAKTVVPQYETFVRTVYGDKFDMSYPTATPITLGEDEAKEISLTIPKATTPQAYDVVVTMLDSTSRRAVSNKLVAHYVLQGVSATIQKVDFTKDTYLSGEEINLSLFWTGSADSFPDSRAGEGTAIGGDVRAVVQIVDKDGKVCAAEINQVLRNEITTIKTIASADCVAPAAAVRLLGPDGTVLDSSSIAVPYTAPAIETPAPTAPQTRSNNLMYVTVIVLALAALSTLIFVSRRKRMVVDSE